MKDFEKRIDEIISKMSISEKVAMCHANSRFTSEGVPSQGLGELTMNDGPHGVREENLRHSWKTQGRTDDFCTYLPTGSSLAATWNPEMGRLHGSVLGEEARFRNKDIILGPGINIVRTPICGRNFEYMSEDPCHISKMVVGEIEGIQSADTSCCVKHFALNNQELDRDAVNAEVSDRALREIYLPGFKAAADAGAYSFMGAYNQYKGQHCCHNQYLVNDILKGEWGWDGVYISDWAGTHDTEQAALYGLDIEMGTVTKPWMHYEKYFLADAFEELCNKDEKYVKALDDKVRRILRLMFRINKFSPDRKAGSFNTKEHQEAAYKIASESIVLLKNNGLLPLDKKKIKKVLVVGENGVTHHCHGGNSSAVKALYEVTPLDGIINHFGAENVEYVKSTQYSFDPIPIEYLDIADMKAGCRGFRLESFDNAEFKGEPTVYFVDKVDGSQPGPSKRFTAVLNIPETGEYTFWINADRGSRFLFNDEVIRVFSSANNGVPYEFTRYYEKGDRIEILAEVITVGMCDPELLWTREKTQMPIEDLLDKARAADLVVYTGGLNHTLDTESFDRPHMDLPGEQNELIPQLAKANPNTVVTITAGSPVTMPWLDEVGAVVWGWYAGMEGGNALADVLCGDVCPSGKMPFTLPVKLEDSPAHRYGEYQAVNCKYNEDIYVGYRGFEKDGIKPLFAFGYGLSYASFAYSNLSVSDEGEALRVAFSITNTSDVDGMEVAQVYIGINGVEDRPVKELKGFEKLLVKAHGTERVEIVIKKEDLRVWNDGWQLLHGSYTVSAAAASDDVRLTANIEL